jgi:Spy/CpxP family protein refolding chaperone
MLHFRNAVLASFAALLSVGTVAFAQRTQGAPDVDPRGVFNLRLMRPILALESKTVRQDLKLTDEQAEKLRVIFDEVAVVNKKFRGGLGELSVEDFNRKLDEASSEAVSLLTDEQKVRIKQIQIWIKGVQSIFVEEVRNELNITDEQKEALLEINKNLRQKALDIPKPTEGNIAEIRRKMQDQLTALTKEFDEKFLAVLTKEQMAKFDAMRGPKIEVAITELKMAYPNRNH